MMVDIYINHHLCITQRIYMYIYVYIYIYIIYIYIYIYTANTTLTAKGDYSCFMQDLTELKFLCLIKLQIPHMKTPGQ